MNNAFKSVDVLLSLKEEENQEILKVLRQLRDLKGITYRVGSAPVSGAHYLPVIFTNSVSGDPVDNVRVGYFEEVMYFLNGYLEKCLAEQKAASEKGLLK